MTARNNQERIGADTQTSAQEAPVAPAASPFSFVVPTDLIHLPSEGRFYEEGSPLHGKDVVEMRRMTTKDEDTLTNASFIKEGVVLDRLLSSLVVNKSIDPERLLLGDKIALLYEARKLGYGPEYNVDTMCTLCLGTGTWEYSLNDIEVRTATQIEEEFGFEYTDKGEFNLNIESMNIDVEMRLLRGIDETRVSKKLAKKKKHKLPEEPALENLRAIIVSVGAETDAMLINEFLNNLPIREGKYLREQYRERVPGVRAVGEYFCDSCETAREREVPMTHEFFWPKR